jgi:DNA-binding NarL/FixJ family response regulator
VADDAARVVVAGEQDLLCDTIHNLLEEAGHEVLDSSSRSPQGLLRTIRGVEAEHVRYVVVLVDPVGHEWVEVARQLREGERVGLVAITARPSYALQRRWHQRARERYLVDGLLSFGSKAKDVAEAVRWAYDRPGLHSAFWLDGDRHPAAFHRSKRGEPADDLRKKPELHETLLFAASGKGRTASKKSLRVKEETVGERLGKIRSMLGVRTDVQLGRRAAELGLFDDLDEYDWPPDEAG